MRYHALKDLRLPAMPFYEYISTDDQGCDHCRAGFTVLQKLSDEPLAIDNDEALERLGDLCDAVLWHDRPIARCVDDSVMLDAGGRLMPIRRSRG
ncbi:MAG: carbamoyltransferase HypF, partial [Wenzhouxiangella sp.]